MYKCDYCDMSFTSTTSSFWRTQICRALYSDKREIYCKQAEQKMYKNLSQFYIIPTPKPDK